MSICITTELRCDECGSHSSVDTATPPGSMVPRVFIAEVGDRTFVTRVRRQAKEAGWTRDGDKDYCPPCSEEREP